MHPRWKHEKALRNYNKKELQYKMKRINKVKYTSKLSMIQDTKPLKEFSQGMI